MATDRGGSLTFPPALAHLTLLDVGLIRVGSPGGLAAVKLSAVSSVTLAVGAAGQPRSTTVAVQAAVPLFTSST